MPNPYRAAAIATYVAVSRGFNWEPDTMGAMLAAQGASLADIPIPDWHPDYPKALLAYEAEIAGKPIVAMAS